MNAAEAEVLELRARLAELEAAPVEIQYGVRYDSDEQSTDPWDSLEDARHEASLHPDDRLMQREMRTVYGPWRVVES